MKTVKEKPELKLHNDLVIEEIPKVKPQSMYNIF